MGTPWDDCYPDECGAQGAAPCIDQLPNRKGAEPDAIRDDAIQSGLASFWDVAAEPPSHLEVSGLPSVEYAEIEGGSCANEGKLEEFSNLTDLEAKLREIEIKHLETSRSGNEAIAEACISLVLSMKQFCITRLDLGKALSAYRAHFRANRGWIAAAKAIAGALCCTDRTVRIIIADYEQVARLPDAVIQVAQAKGVDLAQRRHRHKLVAIELAIAKQDDSRGDIGAEEVERIVSNVLVLQSPSQPELNQNGHFVPLTRAEEEHVAIRKKIRAALTNVELDRKLPVLIGALEEEMFASWDQKEPVTVTIIPRPSLYTLDERKSRAM
jgi:hypothetical protein